MHTETHTGLESPKGIWWKPAHKTERTWVAIAFGWCMVLFAMMPLWQMKGGQNPSGIRRKVEPAAFYARTQEFIKQYQIGDDRGMPIVAPPAGSDIYLTAMSFQWTPILQLEQGKEYILHLSSLDVNHGFSLYPINVNFQVVPGYDYGLRVTPTAAGDFRIICNEFCGIGHHTMVGRVIVVDSTGNVPTPSGGV
ncbi:MAG: cytochrome C oxidase subunit II [Gemmatimonadales bacterium]|jgi:cytochrome c oxidase subunit 2|nr:MAG: cytochrome C oxidase subunit II [Gemmatimonadales bacterium]